MRKIFKPISFWQWLICSLGMFFLGFSLTYISFFGFRKGLFFLIIAFLLEIPAFYLLYKHK